MITANIPTLKINKLTQAQYNRELANDNINDNEIYLTPDEASGSYIIPIYWGEDDGFHIESSFTFSGSDLLEAVNNNFFIALKNQIDSETYEIYTFSEGDWNIGEYYFSSSTNAIITTICLYDDGSMDDYVQSLTPDKSLASSGRPADAKTVGDKFSSQEQTIDALNDEVQFIDSHVKNLDRINQSTYNLSVGYGIIPLQNAGELMSVANNGNTIVAMYEYALYTSLDGGQTWPYRQALPGTGGEIVYGNDKFVIASSNGGAYCSEDGINWTDGTAYNSDSIAFGDGYFVTAYDNVAYYSTDGTTWTQGGSIGNVRDDNYIIYIPSAQAFMILDIHGVYAISDDHGVSWSTDHSSQGSFDSDSLYCVTNTHIVFVEKFSSGEMVFSYSTNALNFSSKQFNDDNDEISSIFYNPNTDIITIFGVGGSNLGYYLKDSELETIEEADLPNIIPPLAPILWETQYCYNDVSKKIIAFGSIINGDTNARVFASDGIDFSNNASIEYNGTVVTEKVKQGLNIPTYIYSTEDLTAGVSELPEGTIYIVYE